MYQGFSLHFIRSELESLHGALLGVMRCSKRERVIVSTLISQQNGRTFIYITRDICCRDASIISVL